MFFEAFGVTLVAIALAELGDKTQMLSLLLASRYAIRPVLLGVFGAVCTLQAVAVLAGGLLGAVLPEGVLAAVTAVLFILFGIWALFEAPRENAVEVAAVQHAKALGVVALVASTFFVAELGDKTQVLTFALAAGMGDPDSPLRILSAVEAPGEVVGRGLYVAVWAGSVVGMMLVNGAAILLGSTVGSRLPRSLVARVSGILFIAFGLIVGVSHVVE